MRYSLNTQKRREMANVQANKVYFSHVDGLRERIKGTVTTVESCQADLKHI